MDVPKRKLSEPQCTEQYLNHYGLKMSKDKWVPVEAILKIIDTSQDARTLQNQVIFDLFLDHLKLKDKLRQSEVELMYSFINTPPRNIVFLILKPWIREFNEQATLSELHEALKLLGLHSLAHSISSEFTAPLSDWCVTLGTSGRQRSYSYSSGDEQSSVDSMHQLLPNKTFEQFESYEETNAKISPTKNTDSEACVNDRELYIGNLRSQSDFKRQHGDSDTNLDLENLSNKPLFKGQDTNIIRRFHSDSDAKPRFPVSNDRQRIADSDNKSRLSELDSKHDFRNLGVKRKVVDKAVLRPFSWQSLVLLGIIGLVLAMNITSISILALNITNLPSDIRQWMISNTDNKPDQDTPVVIPNNRQESGVKIYVFGNGMNWPHIHDVVEPKDITSISWSGPVDMQSLIKTISVANNLETVSLSYSSDGPITRNDKNKFQQDASSLTDHGKIRLPRLKELRFNNFSLTRHIVKCFADVAEVDNLEIFQLANTTVSQEYEVIIAQILVRNRLSLTQLLFPGTEWRSWIFGRELPVFQYVKEIHVQMNERESTTKYSIRRDFCKTFPNIEVFSAPIGDVSWADLNKILECKKMTHLTINLSVSKQLSTISMDFLHKAPATLKKVKLLVNFETKYDNGNCYLEDIPKGTFKFTIVLTSNC